MQVSSTHNTQYGSFSISTGHYCDEPDDMARCCVFCRLDLLPKMITNLKSPGRMLTHVSGQDFHSGVMELVSTGLDIPTAKQIPGVWKT